MRNFYLGCSYFIEPSLKTIDQIPDKVYAPEEVESISEFEDRYSIKVNDAKPVS